MVVLRYIVELALTGLMMWGFFSGSSNLATNKRRAALRFLIWIVSGVALIWINSNWR